MQIRPRPAHLLGLILIGAALVLPACSGDESSSSSSSVTPTSASRSTATTLDPVDTDLSRCNAKAPGVIMTAEEATIRFSNEGVCPGYVTVTTGTSVTWQNVGTEAYTVTVSADPTPDAPVYAEQVVAAGGSWSYEFIEADQYSWRADAIESFVGSVEVRAASQDG